MKSSYLKTLIMSGTAIAVAMVISALLFIAGCDSDFLTRVPPSSLSTATFYETEDDAVAAVNAAYATMQKNGLYGENYHKLTLAPSDDAIIASTTGLCFESFSCDASQAQILEVFQNLYEGVFRANLVLQHVPDIEMSEELKNRIIGEAHFLRGFYYWHLGATFGDVPLIEEANPDNPDEAQKPASDVSEIWEFAIQEFQQAAEALPPSYGPSNVGRATSGAAKAFLGKVQLYAENYEAAESILREVIESGNYELMPSHEEMFGTDNNVEYIFEVQYQDTGGSPWSNQDNANLSEGTMAARLRLPRGGGGFGNFPATQDIVDAFEEGDPRLDYGIWMEGDNYGEPGEFNEEGEFDPDWTPTGYNIRKMLVPVQPNDPTIGTNHPVMRLADVLLMYAEAANENGNRDAALEAVNRVRARSEMPPLPTAEYPTSTKQEMFEAIVHERRVELAFENHRYNDLRRWGLAEEELGPLGYQSRYRWMPLPQSEVDTNEELEQNPDWQ